MLSRYDRHGGIMMTRFALILTFGALLLSTSAFAQQACRTTFNVTKTTDTRDGNCSTSDCSLREAVIAANACSGTNEIVLPAATLQLAITNSVGTSEDLSVRGDLDITGSVNIRGAGSNSTYIDARSIDRIFHVRSGSVSISMLTLRNGQSIGAGGGVAVEAGATLNLRHVRIRDSDATGIAGCGGAVSNRGTLGLYNVILASNTGGTGGALCNQGSGSMVLSQVTAYSNSATSGGVMSNSASTTVTMSDSKFHSNSAQNGAAIINSGNLSINGSEIYNNTASALGGGLLNNSGSNGALRTTIRTSWFHDNFVTDGKGGAVHAIGSGRLAIYQTLFERNSALQTTPDTSGGGAVSTFSATEFYDCTFRDNVSHGGGGAISSSSNVIVHRNSFYGNSALTGGAIKTHGQLVVYNSTFDSNSSTNEGKAISVEVNQAEIKNITIVDGGTAGLNTVYVSPFGSLSVAHSILAGSCQIYGALNSYGYNLDSGETCQLKNATDRSNIGPGLGAMVDVGGLKAGIPSAAVANLHRIPTIISAASNKGSTVANSVDHVSVAGCLKTDARGRVRPTDGRCEIGAVESVLLERDPGTAAPPAYEVGS